jgi:hypothetical protein
MSFGKGRDQPPAPNPALAVQAQAAANKEALRESARLSAIDQYTPFGALTFERDEGGIPTSQITSLTEPQQAILDQQQALAQTLGGRAQEQAGFLPTERFTLEGVPLASPSAIDRGAAPAIGSFDQAALDPNRFGAQGEALAQSIYNQQLSLLQPEFEREQTRLDQRLANQGLPAGGEAYGEEQARFQRGRGDILSRLSQGAVQAGAAEQGRLFGQAMASQGQRFGQGLTRRQQDISEQMQDVGLADAARARGINERLLTRSQPFNELSAFLQGAPSLPVSQFAPPPQFSAQPPDVIGAQFGAANLANQQFANQQATRAANLGGLFGLGGALGGAAILRG